MIGYTHKKSNLTQFVSAIVDFLKVMTATITVLKMSYFLTIWLFRLTKRGWFAVFSWEH